jgi:hypothetical protein
MKTPGLPAFLACCSFLACGNTTAPDVAEPSTPAQGSPDGSSQASPDGSSPLHPSPDGSTPLQPSPDAATPRADDSGPSSTTSDDPGFDSRAAALIRYFSDHAKTDQKIGHWYAEAKFYDYLNSGRVAAKLTDATSTVSNNLVIDAVGGATTAHFALFSAMDCYLRFHDLYGDALAATAQQNICGSTGFNVDQSTPNKILMSATARYLAYETWPTATFGSDFVDPFGGTDPTGYQFLLDQAKKYVHTGEREFDSPNYYEIHYGCFRSLADLAKDPELKRRAYYAAEWLLAKAASTWMNGHWAVSHEREYLPLAAQNDYKPALALFWLMYGGPAPIAADYVTDELFYSVQSVTTSYRVPDILRAVAGKKSSTPYVHRESSWDHFSSSSQFYHSRTSYLNEKYAVYSNREDVEPLAKFDAAIAAYYKQFLRWGISWDDPSSEGNKSTFVIQHTLGPNAKVPNFGATSFEQALQHQGTLAIVYDIPATDPNPWLYSYIAEPSLATINKAATTGRIYLNYGNVLIAVHMTEPFAWDGVSPSFQHNATKVGLVVEVADPAAYAGSDATATLNAFAAAADAAFATIVWDASPSDGPVLKVTAIDGTSMETKFGGRYGQGYDKIDGSAVVFNTSAKPSAWPLIDNPFSHQDFDSDTLVVSDGTNSLTYDFGAWGVR